MSRRLAVTVLILACVGLGAGFEASLATTPQVAVVDVQLPTLAVQP